MSDTNTEYVRLSPRPAQLAIAAILFLAMALACGGGGEGDWATSLGSDDFDDESSTSPLGQVTSGTIMGDLDPEKRTFVPGDWGDGNPGGGIPAGCDCENDEIYKDWYQRCSAGTTQAGCQCAAAALYACYLDNGCYQEASGSGFSRQQLVEGQCDSEANADLYAPAGESFDCRLRRTCSSL